MPRTFQDFAAENLQGFGWQITAEDIPEWETAFGTVQRLHDWWGRLDNTTQSIIGELDIAGGVWNAGLLNDWPGLYGLMAGNRFGDFAHTMTDIVTALNRAHHQAEDEPPGLAGGTGIDDVVNAGNEAEQQ